ncbi:MAG: peroxide stress protein YaaA [Schleiferiaceae bacterium]
MKILLAPSKTMNPAAAPAAQESAPMLREAELLAQRVRQMGVDWAEWYGCSPQIARQAHANWNAWDAQKSGTKAAWTFTGEAFGRLLPKTWTQPERAEERLRILSGLYGILRPSDGVLPYRLDVGQSLDGQRLVAHWKTWVSDWLEADAAGAPVVNCASDEYAEVIDSARFTWIDCVFLQTVNGRTRSVSALSKQARGAMARFLANHPSNDPEVAKTFRAEGYRFRPADSNETRWVFVRTP